MALVAIALVLSAVFLPMAFFGGSTGVIYRQFSVTIIFCDGPVGAGRADPQPGARGHLLKRSTASDANGWSAALPARSPALIERARIVSTRLRAHRRPLRRVGQPHHRPQWLFLGIYAVICACSRAVPAPADRLPAHRGPGRGEVQFRLPAGRDPGAHRECSTRSSNISSRARRRTTSRLCFTVAGGGGGRRRPEYRAGLHQSEAWDEPGSENTADAIASAPPARSGPSRCAGLRAHPRRDPRPRPVDRLHDAVAEHRRHEPRASSRRRATGCSQAATPTGS